MPRRAETSLMWLCVINELVKVCDRCHRARQRPDKYRLSLRKMTRVINERAVKAPSHLATTGFGPIVLMCQLFP